MRSINDPGRSVCLNPPHAAKASWWGWFKSLYLQVHRERMTEDSFPLYEGRSEHMHTLCHNAEKQPRIHRIPNIWFKLKISGKEWRCTVKYERFIIMELCHSTSLHTWISVRLPVDTKLILLWVQLETKEPGNFVATCNVNVLTKKIPSDYKKALHSFTNTFPLLGFIGASRNSTNKKAKTSKAFIWTSGRCLDRFLISPWSLLCNFSLQVSLAIHTPGWELGRGLPAVQPNWEGQKLTVIWRVSNENCVLYVADL